MEKTLSYRLPKGIVNTVEPFSSTEFCMCTDKCHYLSKLTEQGQKQKENTVGLAPNPMPHSAEHVPRGEVRDAKTQEMRELIQRCEVIWNKYSGTDSTK